MNILAFDTCFNACSVAAGLGVGGPGMRVVARFEPMQTGHAERLVPMISDAMSDAQLSWDEVGRIGVAVGPGTFTGTRICVSAARALGLARGIPVVAISSLEVLALGISSEPDRDPDGDVIAAVDARRDEIYVQHFAGIDIRPLSEPSVMPIEAAASSLRPRPLWIVGSGAERLSEALKKHGCEVAGTTAGAQPNIAHALLRIAERPQLAGPIRPLYLRPPDAKPQEGKSVARAAAGPGGSANAG